MDTSAIQKLDQNVKPIARTARYIAVNDGKKDLVLAMADMDIFDQHSAVEEWTSTVKTTQPKWLAVDGNWSPQNLQAWIQAGKTNGSKVAFEPVSAEKSRRLFPSFKKKSPLGLYPNPSIDLITPNNYELAAMYTMAKENGYLDSHDWFEIIDAFGMTGARDCFVRLTSPQLTDAGVPIQSVQLLPYIPNVITKLGADGVLLTSLMGPDDARLKDNDAEEFILARAPVGHPTVGGIYMQLFPAVEKVENVVSVNGVGDTFLGVLLSGLAQGGKLENLVDVAQRGAVWTLKSTESVSPELGSLRDDLRTAARL